jgi:hypothetical protein
MGGVSLVRGFVCGFRWGRPSAWPSACGGLPGRLGLAVFITDLPKQISLVVASQRQGFSGNWLVV